MENLDLTLKLGLPTSDENVESLRNTSLSLRPPMSDSALTKGSGDKKGELSSNKFLGGPYDEGAINNMNVNLMVSDLIMKKFSASTAATAAVDRANSFGASGELNPPLAPLNGYVMLDVPPRRAERERELANAFEPNLGGPGGDGHGGRRNHGETYNEQDKRCTNLNCNTTDTPMWRRGPLGPKTLCNACGIKYRKEEERKRAREATRRRENSSGILNDQFYFNLTD